MQPEQICKELKAAGSSQAALAAGLGVSQVTVSRVINRLTISDRIMRAVAKKIRRKVEDVFPEYYLAPKKHVRSKAFGPPKAA